MGKRSGIGAKKEIKIPDPMEMMESLFAFDALDLFESGSLIQETKAIDDGNDEPEALFYKDHCPSKRELKTVKSNEYLHQVLSGLPEAGTTWHAISNSRFDFASFIPAVINYLGCYTDSLHVATWTTNNINSKQLMELFDYGKIGAITFVVGRYFQSREQAVYNYLCSNLLQRKQTLIVGEHHLKVLLLHRENNYIVIESSANLTSNPRTEQFTYSNDKDLYCFYRNWFEGLSQKDKSATI